MKKLFFIAAIASAALVSCTKNELAPSVTAQEEISFAAPVVGAQTKVYGAIGATYDKKENFDVWSKWNKTEITVWGGTDYIVDKPVTHNAATPGGWHFTPAYYWPADGYLSFVALSPSMSTTTKYTAEKGFEITEWSQGATEATIVDLMYSNESLNNAKLEFNAEGEEISGDANSYKGVDITFNHALSYLVFKIKTLEDYSGTTDFRLKKITLSDIYTTGDFTQKPVSPATNWDVDESDPAKVGEYVAYEGTLPFGSALEDVPETEKEEIILLPQTLADGKQKLIIDYEIKTGDSAWIGQTQEIDLEDGTIKVWEMGKKYTYTISISMTEIILDPAVAAWDATPGGEISF